MRKSILEAIHELNAESFVAAEKLSEDKKKDVTKIPGSVAWVLNKHKSEFEHLGFYAMRKKVLELLTSDEIKDKVAAEKAYRYLSRASEGLFASTLWTYMSGEKVVSY